MALGRRVFVAALAAGTAFGRVWLQDDAGQQVGPPDAGVSAGGGDPYQLDRNPAQAYTTPPAITQCVTWAHFRGHTHAEATATITGRAFAHGRGNYAWSSLTFVLQLIPC